MRVVFVDTPIPTAAFMSGGVCQSRYWDAFNTRYGEAHANALGADSGIWELPHWMPWLAGVLRAASFDNLVAIAPGALEVEYGDLDTATALRKVGETPGDVYLLSPMAVNLHIALKVAEVIKARYPQAHVVFGGVVASPLAALVATDPNVDYVIVGRGEVALPALLAALERNRGVGDVGNLVWRSDNGAIRRSPRVYDALHPSQLPFPDVGILPKTLGPQLRYLRVVHGLGCPYSCAFCTIQTIGRAARHFSTSRVLEEIAAYRAQFGSGHHVYFGDETFTLPNRKARELCDAIATAGGVAFDCQTRLDALGDLSLLGRLAEAGCKWLEIGLESYDQDVQVRFKQGTALSSLDRVLKAARANGLAVCTYLVNGWPNQTLDDMRRSVERVCDYIDTGLLRGSYFGNLVPYPGSPLFEAPAKFGIRIRHWDYRLYSEERAPVFDTAHATAEAIHRLFVEGREMLGEAMRATSFVAETAEETV